MGQSVKPTVPNLTASRSRNTFGSVANLFAVAFVAVVLLFAFGANRIATLAALAWLGAFFLVGCGLIPRWLTRSLQRTAPSAAPDFRGKRTIIILLGDGTVSNPESGELVPGWLAHSRITKAAQLYLAAHAGGGMCTLVVTGDDSVGKRTPSAYVTNLVSLGVVERNIILETRGENTYRQAEHTKERLQTIGDFDALFLVTSGLHMRRALLYFENVGLHPQAIPSDYVTAEITLFPAAYNFAITDIACHQYVGIARMRLYNALGWNK